MSTDTEQNGPRTTDTERNGPRTTDPDLEAAKLAQVVTRRAIRRLDILEWVILVAGVALALVGGAVVGWLISGIAGWDFRATWIFASILLFVVPGSIAVVRIKRDEREHALRMAATRQEEGDDG